jgi:tripartite-type tricarboxylate transporter receptor subunit TctC
MAQFMQKANIKMRHLPTRGGGPALTAFLGNNAQCLVSSISAAMTQIKAGKAKPLAMFGGKRSKALPDVPTMKELGYDLEYYLWVGLFAPKGTPDNVIKVMREASDKAAHTDAFKTAMTNLGQELDYMDQPEFAKFWANDAAKIEAAVRSIGKQS